MGRRTTRLKGCDALNPSHSNVSRVAGGITSGDPFFYTLEDQYKMKNIYDTDTAQGVRLLLSRNGTHNLPDYYAHLTTEPNCLASDTQSARVEKQLIGTFRRKEMSIKTITSKGVSPLFNNMKRTLSTIALIMTMLALMAGLSYALPAFPGAEGFGSGTIGGRGGKIIEVTNLNNSGSGSFREAVEASGARIVVFRTGGTIDSSGDIIIRNPYITIAGQTAPGDGIAIRGSKLQVATHDVIIRNIRVRPGVAAGNDAIMIGHPTVAPYNVILDHCSVSWAGDENFSTWADIHDITIQWSLSTEGLLHSNVSYGMLIGEHAKNISIHHNYFAHNNDRNPLFKGDTTGEVINNVVYNWGSFGMRLKDVVDSGTDIASTVQVEGNHYKPGPQTSSSKLGITVAGISGSRFYVKNNIGPGRLTNTGDDWLAVDGSTAYRVNTPPLGISRITVDDVSQITDIIFSETGAGAVAPHRDSVDLRAMQTFANNSGTWISSESEVGGWPYLSSGTPPADSDHDGMPDNWEVSKNLNPQDSSDGNRDRDSDGYTNIEEYINGLMPGTSIPAEKTIEPPPNVEIINKS